MIVDDSYNWSREFYLTRGPHMDDVTPWSFKNSS
jgi:hypothetical protein